MPGRRLVDALARGALVVVLAAGTRAEAATKAGKKTAPEEPSGPPPSLTITVTPAPVGALWRLRVANTGTDPVRIVADARLVVLDVTPPGAETPTRCELPGVMRPGDKSRILEVKPQYAYDDSFDPRLYCFGSKTGEALKPGASVVAHYGYPAPLPPPPPAKGRPAPRRAPTKPKPDKAPFVARGVDAGANLKPLKAATAATFTVPEAPAPAVSSANENDKGAAEKDKGPPPKPRFSLHGPHWLDAWDDDDLFLSVRVRNEGPSAARMRLHSAAVGFAVLGPGGTTVDCAPVTAPAAPPRELISGIGAGGSLGQSLLLSARCPAATFATAGLYGVRGYVESPHLTTTPVPDGYGDATVLGEPFLVRVRTGRLPAEGAPLRAVPISP